MRIKGDYYLYFWGAITADNWVERDLGVSGNDFWFHSREERELFKSRIIDVSRNRGVFVAFDEKEGPETHKKTIARMKFSFPDGRSFDLDYDFGYGYDESSARYMFFEGNYSCDCNRSLFLSERYPDVTEMECGDKITMTDFSVVFE